MFSPTPTSMGMLEMQWEFDPAGNQILNNGNDLKNYNPLDYVWK